MSIIGQNILAGASGAGGYTIDQSLRFNDGDSGFLSKTLGTPTDNKKWTLSLWFKTTVSSSNAQFLSAGGNQVFILGTSEFSFCGADSGTLVRMKSSQVFRDPSAWMHLVYTMDTTQAAFSDQQKLYINGTRVTTFETSTAVTQNINTQTNSAIEHRVGCYSGGSEFWDGYFAEYYFIDGQVLTPASFCEENEDTGQWQAIEYMGTYGDNGFFLKFEDSAALGNDSSGNNNDFAVTNLTATDQVLDSPTNNFSTLTQLVSNLPGAGPITYSQANLQYAGNNTTYGTAPGTMSVSSGKWYWEAYINMSGVPAGSKSFKMGIKSAYALSINNVNPQDHTGTIFYNGYNGNKRIDGTSTSYGVGCDEDDIIAAALDLDSNPQTITFYKNNSSQGAINFSGGVTNAQAIVPMFIALYNTEDVRVNFGQDSSFAGATTAQGNGGAGNDFYYTPPAGYTSLKAQNLSEPAIIKSGEHMNTGLWTGTGSAIAVTGYGFAPSMIWGMGRTGTVTNKKIYDKIRGISYALRSNVSSAQSYSTTENLTSWDADGFTIKDPDYIQNTQLKAAWGWLGGGTGTANTDGTINTTVSVNADAGFSIVTYTGNGTAGATIGHGLTKAPEMVIVKRLDATADWQVYDVHGGGTKYLQLNDTSPYATDSNRWNDTNPNATVVTLGTTTNVNGNTNTYVAYCFHSVIGYSKVGQYRGTGNADGPLIYTGFRPAFSMIKVTDSTNDWTIWDRQRNYYNGLNWTTEANSDGLEWNDANFRFDYVSDGIKLRSSFGQINGLNNDFIFLAFAEAPFKYANAR